MSRAEEPFGDARLVSKDIQPVVDRQRKLTRWRDVALWTALGLTPAAERLMAAGSRSLADSVVAAVVGLSVVVPVAVAMRRSSVRYGLGLTPLVRAAFGPALAPLVLTARWAIGCLWAGWWIDNLATGFAGLLLASATVAGATATVSPAALRSLAALVLCALLFFGARRGLRGVRHVMRVAGWFIPVCGAGLVVLTGLLVPGFGPWAHGELSPDGPFGPVALGVALGALPAALSAPEWLRFTARDQDDGVFGGLRAVVAVVAGSLWIGASGLLASAALAKHGAGSGTLLEHAGAVAGVAGAWLAAGCALGAFLYAVPLFGGYASSLALCGALPRQVTLKKAVGASAAATALVALALPAAMVARVYLAGCAVLVGVAGVLVADALLVRRGRVVLEDLYLPQGIYATVAGWRLSGAGALVVCGALTLALRGRLDGSALALVAFCVAFVSYFGLSVWESRWTSGRGERNARAAERKLGKAVSRGAQWTEERPLTDAAWMHRDPSDTASVVAEAKLTKDDGEPK